jgi:hypothetical protein
MLDPDYQAMAAEARAAASIEVLENVRQKHLTSAASWEALAHLTSKMADVRAKRLVEQAVASNNIAMGIKPRTRVRRSIMIG